MQHESIRDELRAALRAAGIDARTSERGRPEESISSWLRGISEGVIDIQDGPIRWVGVKGQKEA